MPAAVISIRQSNSVHRGCWSLLEVALPGARPRPYGILLADGNDDLVSRYLETADFDDLEEEQIDFLDYLPGDLEKKARQSGASALLASLEDSLSNFLRISDRTAIEFTGDPRRTADRLFDEHVDGAVRPFVTHLPLYGLRAAATKFGEGMDSPLEEWVRVPAEPGMRARIREGMFVAQVVGRSMEPLIPDGSLCIFREGVTGTRQGKRLLIEKFDETDFAARYTVKRYTSTKAYDENGDWTGHEKIRLEPLNPEFEAFDLSPDAFRVVAEFVSVLY